MNKIYDLIFYVFFDIIDFVCMVCHYRSYFLKAVPDGLFQSPIVKHAYPDFISPVFFKHQLEIPEPMSFKTSDFDWLNENIGKYRWKIICDRNCNFRMCFRRNIDAMCYKLSYQ